MYTGPVAELRRNKHFLEVVAKALRPGGVMSAPAESMWRDDFVIADSIAYCKRIFKGSVNYAWTTIPAYSRHSLFEFNNYALLV